MHCVIEKGDDNLSAGKPLIHLLFLSLSAGQMTDLIYTEKELVQSLREYIKAEESKLAAVKRYIHKLTVLEYNFKIM